MIQSKYIRDNNLHVNHIFDVVIFIFYEVAFISERNNNIQVHLEENSQILQGFFKKIKSKIIES